MDVWRYWIGIARTAAKETFSNFRKKTVRGIIVSVIAFLLQWWVFALRSWTDTQKVYATLVGAALVVFVAEFLWQFIRAPAESYASQQRDLSSATARIYEQERQPVEPRRSPAEAHHYREADKALRGLSDSAKDVLRHLWSHGTLTLRNQVLGHEYDHFEIAGISGADLMGILDQLTTLKLVHNNRDRDDVGVYRSWEITPGFKGVLGDLLYGGEQETAPPS